MKKILIPVFIGTFLSGTSFAQKLTFGPEAGLNLSNVNWEYDGEKAETKIKTGWKIGGIVNIPVYKNLYVQPGIFYSSKGFKMHEQLVLGESNTTGALNYVEIPVNAMYRYGIGKKSALFVTAGPYVAIATNGKITEYVNGTGSSVTSGTFEDDVEFGKESGELKRLDYGANFGLGYETGMGLYFRAQYGLGLANISNENKMSVKNNVIQFSVGYLIGK